MKPYVMPELGGHMVAIDICGDKWIVDAICYADGGAPEGCSSLKDMLRRFDSSGAMRDYLRFNTGYENQLLVGVYSVDDEDDVMVEHWSNFVSYEEYEK